MRIAVVIASMKSGGAQRVCAYLVQHFQSRGDEVGLITFTDPDDEPFFILPEAIKRFPLGYGPPGGGVSRVARVTRWVRGIRRSIREYKPDIVLSFIDATNVMTLIATRGLAVPVVAAERIDPAGYAHRLSTMTHTLRMGTYRWANAIFVQTGRAAQWFGGASNEQVYVIPNPVPPTLVRASPGLGTCEGRLRLIGVGRLDHQKGFDILIAAFARLAASHPRWDLHIFGEGAEHARLQNQIDTLCPGGRISLRGVTADVHEQMSKSHIFAFPSRYEGFPNALAEAMTVGLPTVAMSDVSGVSELVLPGRTGLLFSAENHVGTEAAIADCAAQIESLMQDATARMAMGAAGLQHVQQFAPGLVFAEWTRALDEVVFASKAVERSRARAPIMRESRQLGPS